MRLSNCNLKKLISIILLIYSYYILIKIEIGLEIDQSGMGIYQVEVKEVCLKAAFWLSFRTSYPFILTAAECIYNLYNLLYYALDVLL